MQHTRFFKIIILLLVLLNGSMLAYIWLKNDKQPRGKAALDYMINKLDLNQQQKEQFEQLRREHHENNTAIRELGKQLHDDFFAALAGNDTLLVNQLADSIALLQKQQELKTWKHFKTLRNLCNPEQQKKFDEMIKETMMLNAPPPPGHIGPGRK